VFVGKFKQIAGSAERGGPHRRTVGQHHAVEDVAEVRFVDAEEFLHRAEVSPIL
jgi:hypothetical protein